MATDKRATLLGERVFSYEVKRVAHAITAEDSDKWARRLGLGVVVLTTVVGTSVFTSLNDNPSLGAKIAVAVLSVLAAVAAGAKEYLALDKRCSAHRQASSDYGRLRDIAQELLAADTITDDAITKLDDEAEAADDRDPSLPRGRYDKAEGWVKSHRPELVPVPVPVQAQSVGGEQPPPAVPTPA
jgi:SMODS and SLOG-associating 2TM effector domain family 4